MKCVVSFPGVMEHAQHVALSLHQAGALEAFVTNFAFQEKSLIGRIVAAAPGRYRAGLLRELGRRATPFVPDDKLRTLPMLEILRTVMAKAGFGPVAVDRVWDVASHQFDQTVARRFVPKTGAVVAFEYTALASFERARDLGKARILHLVSLDSRAFLELEEREKASWPELRRPTDDYFTAKFETQQARRQAEIALADVIVVNSTLTKRSHVAAGADPDRVVVVPYGAPPPVAEASAPPLDRPLTVIWSGSFILRKGAHYMLEAWRALAAGTSARLIVYGQVGVPDAMIRNAPPGVEFLGSVPRSRMMEDYAKADVLIFPTLSDGFGLVVTEALSRGVPVITTDQAGGADLIEPGRNGLIVPAGDAMALRDSLQWCLDNRAALSAMRGEALATARARQWSDYRRDHVLALDDGLRRRGYTPNFDLAASRYA